MAFRSLSEKETPPKCGECRAPNPRVVDRAYAGHDWLCAACEYRRAFPLAREVPLPPRAQKPAPLQDETLL